MREAELPIRLTFNNHREGSKLIDSLEQASEQVIWEQAVQEDGSVVVRILNIISLEERAGQEDA